MSEIARNRFVFTECLIILDSVDCYEVSSFPGGYAFRDRFQNPYAVIHRADIHTSMLEATQGSNLIQVETSTKVVSVSQDDQGVTAVDQNGRIFKADALVAADGVRSVIREKLFNDPPRISGHVVYRAVVPVAEMPLDLQINAPVVWAGPDCHLVHYPLRDGQQYNLVVTFHSRDEEEWGVTDGSKEEVLSYFDGICPRARQMLHLPKTWRRWATADRNPLEKWGDGRVTMLGDAAHGMLQYMAQGACMAIEDAVTLGEAMKHCQGDVVKTFQLYEKSRIPRTARVVLSAREMGRLYHANGVERWVRNTLWEGRPTERFQPALSGPERLRS